MDILSAFNKSKDKYKDKEEIQQPENSYWSFVNGKDEKDRWFISDIAMKNTLSYLGIDKDVINDVLLEPVEKREQWLDYFSNR